MKKWAGEWANLKAQQVRFRAFAQAVDGGDRVAKGTVFERIRLGVTDAYATAARIIRDRARANASGGGAPRRLYSGARPAIFSFADFEAGRDDKRKRSSMVGVRTGLAYFAKDPSLYVQWGVGSRRRRDSSIAARGLSMSLGALFERGRKDRRLRPIRYFRGALFATRSRVLQILSGAYKRAADTFQSSVRTHPSIIGSPQTRRRFARAWPTCRVRSIRQGSGRRRSISGSRVSADRCRSG